ncbi:MAG: ArnT family glycosyltransferase [Gemmatimonadota bacterium]
MTPVRWAIAGAVVSLGMALLLFDLTVFTGGDNAVYYSLAEALATGRGYVNIISPTAPPHTVYPPGFPGLLVPFYWIFGGSLYGLKLESWVAGGVVLWAIYTLARRDPAQPEWSAPAAVWVVGLYPVFLIYTHWVLSDMTFLAAVLVALVVLQRADWVEGPDVTRATRDRWQGWWMAGCLVALLAFYVRTAGVTLLAATVAWALMTRRWRRAAVATACFALGAAPWLIWSAQRPPETGSYMQQISSVDRLNPEAPKVSKYELIPRIIDTLKEYAGQEFPQMFWGTTPAPLAAVVFGGLLGGVALGLGVWTLVRGRGLVVGDLYVLLTLGLLAVWPWTGDRFFLTVAPLLWLYCLAGLDRAARGLTGSARPAQVAVALVAAGLFVGAARQLPARLEVTRAQLAGDELVGYAPFWSDYLSVSRWIGEIAPEAIVAARKPSLAWYWSGRPSLVFPFHGDPVRTWAWFRQHRITHIILDPRTAEFLAPTLTPHLDELEIVQTGPSRVVFVARVLPEP